MCVHLLCDQSCPDVWVVCIIFDAHNPSAADDLCSGVAHRFIDRDASPYPLLNNNPIPLAQPIEPMLKEESLMCIHPYIEIGNGEKGQWSVHGHQHNEVLLFSEDWIVHVSLPVVVPAKKEVHHEALLPEP